MIYRSFNRFYKLAFKMSKDKNTPIDKELIQEEIQYIKEDQQRIMQKVKKTKEQLATSNKKFKWKNIDEQQFNKKQDKHKKIQKSFKQEKTHEKQHEKQHDKPHEKQHEKPHEKYQQKANTKPTIFKSTKKYFIDSIDQKGISEKDLKLLNLKQIEESINAGVKHFKANNFESIKTSIQKIKLKLEDEGIQMLLEAFSAEDFTRTISLITKLNFSQEQFPLHFIQSQFFKLAQQKQFKRIQELLEFVKSSKMKKQLLSGPFMELLFLEEVNQQKDYLSGQNSINFSVHNQVLANKIQIACNYLAMCQQSVKKIGRQNESAPNWLIKVGNIVLKYKFAKKQFQRLFTQILTHHTDLVSNSFYQSQNFSRFLSFNYFGKQDKLQTFFDIVFTHALRFKFKRFYNQFVECLMNYKIDNGVPAFQVDQVLIKKYKDSYFKKNKNMALMCLVIANDSHYSELMPHYLSNHEAIFNSQNEAVAAEQFAMVQDLIVNNYNRVTDAQDYQKIVHKTKANGFNSISKIKASIKLGELAGAYKIFNDQILKFIAIQRQRQNIYFVLKAKLGSRQKSFFANKDISTFVSELQPSYLLSLHKRSEDISAMLKDFIPQDKFSFWEEVQKKQRYDQIVRLKYSGKISNYHQPEEDAKKDGFNLKKYIENQLEHLEQQDKVRYEKQKQIIRYKLRVSSLSDLIRVRPDKFVQQKLNQYQAQLSADSLLILQNFGIKDYDIVQYGWDQFNLRFSKMINFNNVPKDQNALRTLTISEQKNQFKGSIYSKNKIQQLLIKSPQDFREASRLVKLPHEPLVESLILWGVYTKQPMAIYMGEKLAMLTGQQISHEVAIKVSDLLSYRRIISEQFIDKCKESLQIIGKINRQNIYDMNKDYHHILFRRQFVQYAVNVNKEKGDDEGLSQLLSVNPLTKSWQDEPKFFIDSIIQKRRDYI